MKRREVLGLARPLLLSAVAASAALLASCNKVISEKPWFSAAEAQSAPVLKPGLWVPCCSPNENFHANREIEITSSEIRLAWTKDWAAKMANAPPSPLMQGHFDYLIIGGDPLMIQLKLQAPPEFQHDPTAHITVYLGFTPTERDADGRVVAGEVWPLMCGPAPKPGDENYGLQDEQRSVTNHPLPGLTMVNGSNCIAKDRAALIKAARDTRTMDGFPVSIRWRSAASSPNRPGY